MCLIAFGKVNPKGFLGGAREIENFMENNDNKERNVELALSLVGGGSNPLTSIIMH